MTREKLEERIDSLCDYMQEALKCEVHYDIVDRLKSAYQKLDMIIEKFDREKWEDYDRN